MTPEPKDLWAPAGRKAALSLFGAALALYAVCIPNGFTNWDDDRYVVGNPFAAMGAAGLGRALVSTFDHAYYPLTQALQALLRLAFGTFAPAHHAVSVLLFAAAAALVPSALGAFGVRRGVAFWAALFWLCHPYRVESVAWAANLKDVTSLLAVLATFALLARGKVLFAALAFTAALLCKTMVFPVALLIPFALPGTPRRRALTAAPFLVLAVAAAAMAARLHFTGPPPEDQRYLGGSLLGTLPSALYLPWWYLGRVLVPRLQATWAFEPVTPTDGRFLLAVALSLACAAGLVLAARRKQLRGPGLVALGWFLPFAPVVGLAPLAFPVAVRYTLLPSLALACAAAVLAQRALAARTSGRGPGVAALAVLGALAVATLWRQREWRSAQSLWEADRARAPDSWAARVNLAGAYGGQARWPEAITELEEARRILPTRLRTSADLFFAVGANRGMAPAQLDALHDELLATRARPELWHRVAAQVLKEGYPDAAAVLLEALLAQGVSARAHALLAKVEISRKRYKPAAEHAHAALLLSPSDLSPTPDLVLALVENGDAQAALGAAAVQIPDPKLRATVKGLRAYALFKLGRSAEAAGLLAEANRELAALGAPPP